MRKFFLVPGIFAVFSILGQLAFGGSDTRSASETRSVGKVPTFTLNQAILTALQRNPALLNAEQEIKRTRGVIIQVRAQVLPQVTARGNFEWIDPHLQGARIFGPSTTGTTTTPGTTTGGAASLIEALPSQVREVQTPLAAPSPTPAIISTAEQSDVSYTISVLGTQLIFNGTSWPQIRGTFFQRDSAYFAFRNILDQLIAIVKTQFYQIVVNRELVSVNEQSVHLLEAQLKDQQNRFEAGTVPRFNVLQAEVALYNQLPLLIAAQNNLRIAKITLAKTLGLDFQPRRGESPPLEVAGEMPYIPRSINLANAIELGKERRPFLKEALRRAKARPDAGAGTQLDVLNAQVQLLTAQSTRLQALFGYNSALAEFDRATGAQSTYQEMFANLAPRATQTKTYYTGSGVDAEGKPKRVSETTVRTSATRSRTVYSK